MKKNILIIKNTKNKTVEIEKNIKYIRILKKRYGGTVMKGVSKEFIKIFIKYLYKQI